MTKEELKQKAIESVKNIIKDNPIDEDYQTKDIYFRDLIDAYIAGSTETTKELEKQLTKAKKIIREFIDNVERYSINNEILDEAEAFLKEIRK